MTDSPERGSEGVGAPLDAVVGRNVRELREAGGLTQRQLAEKLAEGGWRIDSTAITRIEKGERSLRVSQLEALSRVFKCEVQDLFDSPAAVVSQLRHEVHRSLRGARVWLARGLEAVEQVWQYAKNSTDSSELLAESGLQGGLDADSYPELVLRNLKAWIDADEGGSDGGTHAHIFENAETIRPTLERIAELVSADLLRHFKVADEDRAAVLEKGGLRSGVPEPSIPEIGTRIVG